MLLRVLLLCLFVGLIGRLEAANNDDPSEEFVAAYRSFKEAERLDQAGRKEEAITKYRYAENHLLDISNNYPNWQKPIVEYRLSKIRNNLARINGSSGSTASAAYDNAGRSSSINDRPAVTASSENSIDTTRPPEEEGGQEPRYADNSHESSRYGSEATFAEETPISRSPVSESEGIESAPQTASKRGGDIPTLSIIPPTSKNTTNKELLLLQKQLKRTESDLEKAHKDIIDKISELDQSKVSLVETKAQLTRTERQLVDLKSDLEKNRVGNLQREASLKKSLEQLEGKVAALSADKEVILEENSYLQQHLQDATNSLAMAFNNKTRLEQLQVEVNAEKNASAALHEQLAAAQRERDAAHAESATLVQQVKEIKDSLAIAQKKEHDLETLQTQVTGLQQQLKQTNTSLAEAQQKNGEMDALKTRLMALTAEGANKEKMLARTQETNKKLQASQKNLIDDLQKKLATAEADQEVLNEERSAIKARLKQATMEIAVLKKSDADTVLLQQQVKKLTQDLEKNTKQLSDAQAAEIEAATNQKQSLVKLEEKLRVVVMERQNMEMKKRELEKELIAANEKIKSLTSQPMTDVAALQHNLQQSQNELQAVKKQLEDSAKKIVDLEKSRPDRDQFLQEKEKELITAREEAAKFQKELQLAQQQLASIQQEMKAKDDRYNDLKKQLDQKNEEIATLQKKAPSEAGQEKVIAENELLKGIVLRELKAEAKRQQLRKLIVEDLDKLKVKSDTLSLQLRKLAKPVKLTPEECALFKDKLPLSPEAEQDDDKLIVTVETSKNDKNSVATNNSLLQVSTNVVTPTTSPIATNAPTEMKKEEGKETKKEGAVDQEKYRVAINKAKEQFEHQNYAEAEKNFQDALKFSPNDYMTLSNLGVVEFQLGKMSEAETVLKKACVQDPKKSFAFTTLGIVNYRQERFDEAEKVLRQAVAINDQDFTAHNYLGIVLAASGKSKAGESELMKSIEINPNYADAHFNLAVIYATGKSPVKEMAKKHYKKAVSLGALTDPRLEKLIN